MSAMDRILAQPRAVRRALALLLVPVAAFVVWGAVFVPVRWIATSQDEWRQDTRRTLARARGHAQSLVALQKQVDALPAAPVWQRFYVLKGGEGGSGAVQQDVSNLCASAGLESQSITPLPSESAGKLTKYAVRLSASGSSDRLKLFLAKLREQPRYLRVDRLNVSAPQMQSADQNPVLTINMDIAGFASDMPVAGGQST